MPLQLPGRGAFVPAICSELEPFGWRSLTPEMLARRVIGAVDRHSLAGLLGLRSAMGAAEPADRTDERVAVLVEFMGAHRWRTWTLPFLARQLFGALDAWWANRQSLEAELGRLISGGG